MSAFINAARVLFKKHPFVTNSVIYGSLYVGAEYSQQYVSKRLMKTSDDSPVTAAVGHPGANLNLSKSIVVDKEAIDYATIGRYAVMGTIVFAPTLYTWYKWLDRTFPGTARLIIAKKLVLDQFLLTPYLLTVFYTGMSLMEGADDTFLELREKFMPTFIRSCLFWLPAQLFNFIVIPPKFRVIYMGGCGFVWVNILCWIKRQNISVTPLAENNNSIVDHK